MQPRGLGRLAATPLFLAALAIAWANRAGVQAPVSASRFLHPARSSPSDLEVAGELAGLPAGSVRYLTREDLLMLPQVSYTVSDDPNFVEPTEVSGVLLKELTRSLSAAPESAMVVAICSDQYRANYPLSYMAEHNPILVLKIEGKSPAGWPKDSENHREDMGPFMISHPKFTPSFKILSHSDEAQVPWGVVRLEFRDQNTVLGAIAPRGPDSNDELVRAGYRIAQQNCFRCHNMGKEGGTKAGHPWLVLSAWATSSPEYFAAYVRNPKARNPNAQMPGNPGYDSATMGALIAYFKTFDSSPSPVLAP